ncbi:MAG: phospholipase D family protein [Verrucomicrobia bacterium]|nr:phospholipase D family protein [Verrucomicrobiota bacterium]
MFYNQPLVHRFGKALTDDLVSEDWRRAEFAVAWVRRSGTQHLAAPFREFLKAGGAMQITVGVDIENTSHEGLNDLLALENEGSIETFIHHNEADVTFHPKVYLLRNDKDARLIVGSNNLTGAGLFLNTEAGLQIDAPLTDPVITSARSALAAWRDPLSGLAHRLDKTLLNDLLALGYIHPESELRRRRKGSAQSKKKRSAESALFKFQRVTGPEAYKSIVKAWNVAGTVLLMRVRRASESERRTQVQIPIKAVRTAFFTGIAEIVSAHDTRAHPLVEASARGSVNTIKAEIPEIATMSDPVLRLERTPNAILYTAFDAASVLGTPIREALLNGFKMNPPATFQTIADRSRATWWRFV